MIGNRHGATQKEAISRRPPGSSRGEARAFSYNVGEHPETPLFRYVAIGAPLAGAQLHK